MSRKDKLADQSVQLAVGQTIILTFTKPVRRTVIVLVCSSSDKSIYFSSITLDGSDMPAHGD